MKITISKKIIDKITKPSIQPFKELLFDLVNREPAPLYTEIFEELRRAGYKANKTSLNVILHLINYKSPKKDRYMQKEKRTSKVSKMEVKVTLPRQQKNTNEILAIVATLDPDAFKRAKQILEVREGLTKLVGTYFNRRKVIESGDILSFLVGHSKEIAPSLDMINSVEGLPAMLQQPKTQTRKKKKRSSQGYHRLVGIADRVAKNH
jgi:hypothetical protein